MVEKRRRPEDHDIWIYILYKTIPDKKGNCAGITPQDISRELKITVNKAYELMRKFADDMVYPALEKKGIFLPKNKPGYFFLTKKVAWMNVYEHLAGLSAGKKTVNAGGVARAFGTSKANVNNIMRKLSSPPNSFSFIRLPPGGATERITERGPGKGQRMGSEETQYLEWWLSRTPLNKPHPVVARELGASASTVSMYRKRLFSLHPLVKKVSAQRKKRGKKPAPRKNPRPK